MLILLVVYAALQRFSPILPAEPLPGADFTGMNRRYRRFNRLLAAGFLLTWVSLTFLLNWLLDALLTFRLSFLYDVLYIVPPDYRVVLFNASCIAFLLALFIFWRIAYFKTLTQWEEYQHYVNHYFRFDIVRVTKHVNRLLSLFTVLLTLLVFDWYTTFGDEEIKANDLVGLGTRKYEYNHIVEVKDVKKRANLLGDIVDKPFCVMTFEDQYKWKNFFMSNDEQKKMLNLVLARTQVNKRDIELDTE